MNNSNQLTINNESINLKRVFWAAVIFTIVAFSSVVLSIFLILTSPSWQVYLITGISTIALIVDIIGLWLIQQDRAATGLKLLYWSSLITVPPNVLLVTSIAPFLIGIVLFVGFIHVFFLHPRSWRKYYFSGPIIASAVILFFEWLQPPFRLALIATSSFFSTSVLIFLTTGIFILYLRQSQEIVNRSLRLKITVWMGLILAGSAIILIGYSSITGRQTAIDSATNEALAITSSEARQIRADTEIPLDTARALAQALTALKNPTTNTSLSRDQVNAILQQVLIENPTFLGTYTLWEPNAFDGLDADFKNTTAHDATGRFIPYWVRADDGSVNVTALLDYETPGIGDWYLQPRETKKEVTVAPLIYPINGVDTVMASFVVPIIYNNEFYGIAGVDAPISFVQGIVDKIDLYNGTAEAVLMTDSGTLLGVRNKPELVNQPATEIFPDFSDLQARLNAGEAFISPSPDGEYLRAFSPVDLGLTGKHWSFALVIPITEITAPATATAIRQGLIGLGLIVVTLVILWFLSGQLVSPLGELTTVANAVSQGNLNIRSEVKAVDETGMLANAFNLMITQLRESFATLEQRVADRTRGLELASEVGRTVSQVRALDVLLTDAAEIIRSQFNLYYVQVYLTNPSQTALILQAGTGTVGEELLSRAHQLPLNTASINGRAAFEKQSVVISDTTSSSTFRPNPLLPDTRSEMAVPLVIGETVVGVLDMQSRQTNQLNKEGLSAFEALAGQLAIAIQNATLLAQTEQARAEVEVQARRQARANWKEYLDAIHKPEEIGFVYEKNKVTSLSTAEQSERQVSENSLNAPIEVVGESLGNIIVELAGQSPISRTSELVNTVARQMAQQIENLRLLENAERYRSEAEEASRRVTHEGWKNFVQENTGEGTSYLYDLKEVKPYHSNGIQHPETDGLTLPLKVRDETIGKLVVQGIDKTNNEAFDLATAVAERLSAHIEGLRLSNQTEHALFTTQRQAEREQALRQITSAVRGSTDPATILRSAARELGTFLGRKTVIRLTTDSHTEGSALLDGENTLLATKSPSQES